MPDFRHNEIKIGEAVYKHVGECRDCGRRVFRCTSAERADEEMDQNIAVYYTDGTVSCRRHWA